MLTPEAKRALVALAESKGDEPTPDDVIAAAMDPESPLHPYIEWDTEKAATAHRRAQARAMITSIKYEIRRNTYTIEVPAYVRHPGKSGRDQGYISLDKLKNEADLARDTVVAEFARAATALKRAQAVAVALGMEDDIDELSSRVQELTERAQASA